MSGDAIVAAGGVLRSRVHRVEHLLEDVLAEGGALVADLVAARRAVGLATVVGQPVFAAVLEALDAAAAARGKIIAAHRQLDRMGQALGMGDPGYGDGGKDIFDPTGAIGAAPVSARAPATVA